MRTFIFQQGSTRIRVIDNDLQRAKHTAAQYIDRPLYIGQIPMRMAQ